MSRAMEILRELRKVEAEIALKAVHEYDVSYLPSLHMERDRLEQDFLKELGNEVAERIADHLRNMRGLG